MGKFSFAGITVLPTLCIAMAVATPKIDFSGTWKLKDQQNISGILYKNGVPRQIKINQSEQAMTMEKITLSVDREDITTLETLNFDGSVFETITTSKRKKLITIKWADDNKTFTVKSNIYIAGSNKPATTYTDKYSLENNQLILIRHAENFDNGEIWESRSIYEKSSQ